jgi:hypothetical protein
MKKQNNNPITKLQKIVWKMYPNCFAIKRNGKYTIIQEQRDLTYVDVLQELFFAPPATLEDAWKLAATTTKTQQNLLRTHPLRIEGQNLEDKLARIEARKNKKYDEYL